MGRSSFCPPTSSQSGAVMREKNDGQEWCSGRRNLCVCVKGLTRRQGGNECVWELRVTGVGSKNVSTCTDETQFSENRIASFAASVVFEHVNLARAAELVASFAMAARS